MKRIIPLILVTILCSLPAYAAPPQYVYIVMSYHWFEGGEPDILAVFSERIPAVAYFDKLVEENTRRKYRVIHRNKDLIQIDYGQDALELKREVME